MAIRVKLPATKQPSVKVDPAFSGDRAAALARLTKLDLGPAPPKPEGSLSAPPMPAPALPPPPLPAVPLRTAASIRFTKAPAPAAPVPAPPPDNDAGAKPGEGVAPAAAEAEPPAEAEPGAATAASENGEPAPETASGAVLVSSSAPAMLRASGLLIRWAMVAVVLLVVAYASIRFLVPFLQEIRNPTKGLAAPVAGAPTAVRVLQQTRGVVDKNDAKVAYLNEVIASGAGAPDAAPLSVAPSAPPIAVRPKGMVEVGSDEYMIPYQEAVARMNLGGVFEGTPPVVHLNGRIVKYAEIIDRDLGLRFVGVDTENKAVLFSNGDNVIFRKNY